MNSKLPEPPSAGVLLEAVLAERQARLESADAMTNRAGIILGFTGVLVSLSALLDFWVLRLVVFVPAGFAVRYSLAALRTEIVPGLEAVMLREKLLMQPPLGAQLQILDIFTKRHDELVRMLDSKASRVDLAGGWLAITIVVLAVASLLGGAL
jgi:hypothetical protein